MQKKDKLSLFICIGILFACAGVSLCVGKYPIGPEEVRSILFGGTAQVSEMTRKVFWTLRFPRTVMTVLSGMGLGIAGGIYQIIFKNPLASPDIIGIAGGANLGAAVAIVSVASGSMFAVAAGAFWGGLAAVLAVSLMVRITGSTHTSTYVLAGIVINAVSKTLIMTLKYFADPEDELAAMEYWEMGTFGNVTMTKLTQILPLFLVGLTGILLLRRQIELMALGDNEARSLGVRLGLIRTCVLLLSTLMVSSVICMTGLISFIGLIAPHIARLILKRNNAVTMIFSGLVGAAITLASDILARTLYSAELPISILTTLIGIPMLVYFICRRGREAAI